MFPIPEIGPPRGTDTYSLLGRAVSAKCSQKVQRNSALPEKRSFLKAISPDDDEEEDDYDDDDAGDDD
ncbi:hypothetical protein CSKR_202592 [Clonorchis sinensis]|uniref:Uncharacterized protein n=1 Tax=Clonorchis sinensis TaxID=79923 RepID=A0A8T1LZU5_CLOSI|nr:hypothetical protein CSKR_202592 [Clonorchis sinensis]